MKKLVLAILIGLVSAVCVAQMPPNLENGFKHWGSFEGSSVDTVNNLNGNQMLHAPLLPNYPQRGSTLSMQPSLYQTSKAWQVVCTVALNGEPTCQWTLQRPGVSVRQSDGLLIQRTIQENGSGTGVESFLVFGYSIQDATGTTHQVVASGPLDSTGESTKFDSIDTSGYHLEMSNPDTYGVMNTATVTDRHGKQYVTSTWFGGTDTGPTLCPQLPGNMLPQAGPIAPIIDDAPMGIQNCSQVAFADQVTDSNGNRIVSPLAGGTDTLGRTFSFFNGGIPTTDYSGCVSSHTISYASVLSYVAPDTTTRQIKLCYGLIPIQTAFNVSGIADTGNFSSPQLVTVVLGDGTKWTFDYDNYGEATFVGLPSGGSISYTWTTIAFPSCAIPDGGVSRAVATRTLNDNNGHSSFWQYNWGTVVNGVISNTVTDPLNNDSVHVFTALDGTGAGSCHFYETRTQSYQGTGGSRQLLKQVDTTYSFALFNVETSLGSGMGNAVPTSILSTIYPSGKANLVQKTYAPPPAPGLPISGAVATEKVYDWGQGAPGPLLRETDTVYQWQKDSSYLAAGLLDLPASVVVISPNAAENTKSACPISAAGGTANCISETDYTYDEPSYLATPSPAVSTQHVSPPFGVRGNLTTVSRWLNTSNAFVTSHTKWYDTGEPYQQIDPLGHTTTHSYDPAYVGAYSTQTCSPQTGTVAHCVSGTYDFNTGVLTSLTNENATLQASGNTPGDDAHTSRFNYDYMFRITSTQAPPDPDPANNGLRAQTSFNFSPPNTFPLTVQRTKSITAALSDSATNFFDGLGRVYRGQHVVPGNVATVDTTFDPAGHPASVTNPYFTTADATYGFTTSQYDGLDRVTQTIKQDGSVSSVAYNVVTGAHDLVPGASTVGDCTDTKDEAGKQRRTCVDGLGRLVMVAEPNPGAAATTATGVITINGSEQTTGGAATAGSTTITVTGTERSTQICLKACHTLWDAGTVTITVTGYPGESVTYGSTDTPATVAWKLSCAFHNDGSAPVDAQCPASAGTSTTVNLTARTTGSATNYSFTTSSATSDTSDFSGSSFFAGPSSGTFTGGNNAGTPDSGNITVTVNGANYTVSFGAGDTGSSIATRLASAMSASTVVSASPSGNQVNLTSRTVGSAGNASLSASYTWNNSVFAQGSFTPSAAGVLGGYDATLLDNNPYTTVYAYDALGDLLRVDQKGSAPSDSTQWRTRLFTYDSLGRLLTANNPESGTITYSYDLDGNLLQKTSPAPNQTGTTQTITYCYDELHRVTGRAYGALSCPLSAPVVSYVYDARQDAKGKLTSLTDQAGTASYFYDTLGRLTSETRSISGVSKSLSYTYNLDGSMKSLTYPSGATVTYAPDSAGRILSAIDAGNGINYVTGATYGPDGAITGFVSGNSGTFAGITNAFSYNKRLQPINMSALSPSQTVFSIGYDFHMGNGVSGSDNGNVFGITNYKDNTRNQSFTYDALNRLTSAQNAGTDCGATTVNGKTEYWGNNYGYDAWGNLTQKVITKCGAEHMSLIALPNNQLSGYGYDAAGNMTSDPTDQVSSTYDEENRVSIAVTPQGTFTYTYDGDGNRVMKSNGTAAAAGTLYWYMTPGIVAESDQAGTLRSEYVFFGGERVARRDLVAPTGVFYYFSDHLKTASVITDPVGNIKSESDYYPWGGELQFVANDSNHYKFTGKERDTESGLDYFGARYYSNGLGRFISADWSATPVPVPYADFSDPQSLNQYSYVRNIPTVRADADGHDGLWDTVKATVHDLGVAAGNTVENVGVGFITLALEPDKALSGTVDTLKTAAIGYGTSEGRAQLGAQLSGDESTTRQVIFQAVMLGGTSVAPGAKGEGAGIESLGNITPKASEVPTSIPAGPSVRPTPAQQSAINAMGKAHGCHTCGAKAPGTKSGNWVGDHQKSTALNPPGAAQVYKPQCLACSRRQGGLVRAAKAAAAKAAHKKEQTQSQ